MPKLDEKPVIEVLNRLLEAELAGVVRYTHYSFLVFGFGRIPIVSWLRAQAEESMAHAQQLGEWITTLGADPDDTAPVLLQGSNALRREKLFWRRRSGIARREDERAQRHERGVQ